MVILIENLFVESKDLPISNTTTIEKEIPIAILNLIQDYKSWGIPLRVINTGHCLDFAEEIMRRLKLPSDSFTFMENYYGEEDIEFPLSRLPEVLPPSHAQDNDLRLFLSTMTHVWITYKGRHYDAEAPYGVDHVWELPLIKRLIKEYYSSLS